MFSNRTFTILSLTFLLTTSQQGFASEITVYKSATCGCCTAWIDHLKAAGFDVKAINSDNMDSIKEYYGVSTKLASCHTATADGYVLEGHVPAADIKRLLKEKPVIAGLSAPGMPMQSPGMQAKGLALPFSHKSRHRTLAHGSDQGAMRR